MIDTLIASIIIIGIMLFFVFVMFRNIIKRINYNAKKYFVKKLEAYNGIALEKEQQIKNLNEEIEALQRKRKELEQFGVQVLPKKARTTKTAPINTKVPQFREENFFFNYKELKQNFNFDKEELIKEFIKEHHNKEDEKSYKVLKNLKNKFNKDAIYQLMTLPSEEQMDIVKKIITESEKKLIDLDSLSSNETKFTIALFLKKIDEKLLELDPTMNIYVSKYDKNYDYIDPYIKTKKYDRMSEGIIIEYKGKNYDFSI